MTHEPPESVIPMQPPAATGRCAVPAWLLSIVFHLLLLLLSALAIGTATQAPTGEPDRPVSIVLARHDGLKRAAYFQGGDENDRPTDDAADVLSRQQNGPLPDEAAAAPLLAPGAELPAISEGIIAAGAGGNDLVQRPAISSAARPHVPSGLDVEALLADDPVRNRPPGPSGPEAELAPFGVAARGRSFVFLIDRSNSMGEPGLGAVAAAERELVRNLARLKPEHRFQIIAYNQRRSYLSKKGMVPATDENKRLAARFLAGVIAVGSTEHELALSAALRQGPDVIFLLTDAGDPPLGEVQIRRIVERAAGKTAIYCIRFGPGPPPGNDDFLRELARRTRGTYAQVDMSKVDRGL